MQKLPPPEEGKQYQMWVIQDGKPVSMGVLPMDMTEGKVAKLPMEVKHGQAFAISLETMGGNPTPTQVYVLGGGVTSSTPNSIIPRFSSYSLPSHVTSTFFCMPKRK